MKKKGDKFRARSDYMGKAPEQSPMWGALTSVSRREDMDEKRRKKGPCQSCGKPGAEPRVVAHHPGLPRLCDGCLEKRKARILAGLKANVGARDPWGGDRT